MAQTKATSALKKIGRKKELNIIYFVDSSSTRAFKLSIQRAQLILALFIALVVWSIGSVGIIYTLTSSNTSLENRISSLLNSTFDYQAKFDAVYEKAYPENLGDSNAKLADLSADEPSTPPDESQRLSAKALVVPPVQKQMQQDLAEVVQNPKNQQKVAGIKVEIEEPTFRDSPTKLAMDFAIKNTRGADRASGLVYAIALMHAESGGEVYVAQPPTVEADSTGLARQPQRATPFTIRRFKPVTVEFPKPEGVAGIFRDVKIVISDDQNQRQEYKFEVKLAGKNQQKPNEKDIQNIENSVKADDGLVDPMSSPEDAK
jgi:hypothetical protein